MYKTQHTFLSHTELHWKLSLHFSSVRITTMMWRRWRRLFSDNADAARLNDDCIYTLVVPWTKSTAADDDNKWQGGSKRLSQTPHNTTITPPFIISIISSFSRLSYAIQNHTCSDHNSLWALVISLLFLYFKIIIIHMVQQKWLPQCVKTWGVNWCPSAYLCCLNCHRSVWVRQNGQSAMMITVTWYDDWIRFIGDQNVHWSGPPVCLAVLVTFYFWERSALPDTEVVGACCPC